MTNAKDFAASPPRFRIEGFELVEALGSGGMASVFLAVQEGMGRKVAVKVMAERFAKDQAFLVRFKREARLAAQFVHPGIVTVYSYGLTDDGRPYLAMEYVQGGDLRKLLGLRGPLSGGEATRLLRLIASALAQLHASGVIHRDLKPENILFRGDVPVLADFGIARHLSSETDLTAPGIIGSANYVSPEQIRGEPASLQSDLYALGVVFYEMLTNAPPFHGSSIENLLRNVLESPIPQLPSALAVYQPLIDSMVARDPARRVSSASAIVDRVEELETMLARGQRDPAHQGPGQRSLPETASAHQRDTEILPFPERSGRRRAKWFYAAMAFSAVLVLALAASVIQFSSTGSREVTPPGGVSDANSRALPSWDELAPDAEFDRGPPMRDSLRSGGLGPELVIVPPGRFTLGCVSGDQCEPDELPLVVVSMTSSFAISSREITRSEFSVFVDRSGYVTAAEHGLDCIMYGVPGEGLDGTWRAPGFDQTADHPVVCVSQVDAQQYVGWLSRETGFSYRLPSEAEWEYATRAGSTDRFFFGSSEEDICRYANGADSSSRFSWAAPCSDASGNATTPAGSFEPNAWGLFDTSGNVMEWTSSCWTPTYDNVPVDSAGWLARSYDECEHKGLRGGSWIDPPQYLRSASRSGPFPYNAANYVGFRVARHVR